MPSIILTRSAGDNRAIAPLFESRGLAVRSAPMIEFLPLPKDMCGLRSVRRLAGGDAVLITSAFAADLWLDLRETDFREHAPSGYYVVGATSADLLRDGDPEIPIRAVADSVEELLAESFAGVDAVLYPCSTERRDIAVDRLRERGIDVMELPLYSPGVPSGARAMLNRALAAGDPPAAILFFSPSAVRNFHALDPVLPSGVLFGAIGATTATALRERGHDDVIIPPAPTVELLAEAIARALAPG
ncbi:MAG: Uroporphyrinogen synthase [Chlorobi bacterium]|nr:Uroporphyrinogen synthase [Chlorobiota bacterium]